MKVCFFFGFNGWWSCSPSSMPNLIKNKQAGLLRHTVEKLDRKTLISENKWILKIEVIAHQFL